MTTQNRAVTVGHPIGKPDHRVLTECFETHNSFESTSGTISRNSES